MTALSPAWLEQTATASGGAQPWEHGAMHKVWKCGSVSWRGAPDDWPLPGLHFYGNFFQKGKKLCVKNDTTPSHLPGGCERGDALGMVLTVFHKVML